MSFFWLVGRLTNFDFGFTRKITIAFELVLCELLIKLQKIERPSPLCPIIRFVSLEGQGKL